MPAFQPGGPDSISGRVRNFNSNLGAGCVDYTTIRPRKFVSVLFVLVNIYILYQGDDEISYSWKADPRDYPYIIHSIGSDFKNNSQVGRGSFLLGHFTLFEILVPVSYIQNYNPLTKMWILHHARVEIIIFKE